MEYLFSTVLTIHILAALGVIGLVLVQHGKGADMGAAFGSGSAGSVFGASGSANFLSRSAAVLATVFFIATLALAYLGNSRPAGAGSVLEGPGASIPAVTAPASEAAVPVAPVEAASGAAQIPSK